MANGTYGIKKPANISPSDVDIFYSYRPTRGSESPDFKGFKTLPPESVLNYCNIDGYSEKHVNGLYNLRLPLEKFKNKGIYTVYIKPKEVDAVIEDVSTLTGDFANVRGVVFSATKLSESGITTENGSLVGYRIEFGNGEYRIITSSNKCEPVSQTPISSTIQKGVRYRFNDASELIFCTVTPSTASSFKSTSFPYIGMPAEEVKLVNTKFNPVMIEVEMTNHDIDTVSTMLEGAQVRNLDNGIITTFDEDGNIYHQAAYGNIVKAGEDMHADFKIPYDENYESSEKEKFEEIVNQVRNV